MIFGLAAIGSSFDGVIAVLVYTVINNLSSLSLPFPGIMTIYNNLSVQKILFFKLCNMAAMLFL